MRCTSYDFFADVCIGLGGGKRVKFSILCTALLMGAASVAARDFRVQDFGAKGDGSTLDTVAIQKTIDTCAEIGGGRVILRDGKFRAGTLFLRSHVDLHIEKSAVLLGSQKEADYPRTYRFRHHNGAKMPRYDSGAWLIADEAKDVSITGEGVIDCDGDVFVEKKPLDPDGSWSGWEFRRKPSRKPVPRVVVFTGCSDVRVQNITFTRAPAGWGFWVHDCDRVRFAGVQIKTNVKYPNNDGIHINASRDVLVEDCDIETGDDSIVVRANCVTLRENKPCERVTVRNCRLRSFTNGIRPDGERARGFARSRREGRCAADARTALSCCGGRPDAHQGTGRCRCGRFIRSPPLTTSQ